MCVCVEDGRAFIPASTEDNCDRSNSQKKIVWITKRRSKGRGRCIYWSEIAKRKFPSSKKVGSFFLKEIVLLHLLWKSRNTSRRKKKNPTSSLRNLKYFNQLSSWMAGGQKLHHTLIHLISDQVFWHLAVWCISKNIRSLEDLHLFPRVKIPRILFPRGFLQGTNVARYLFSKGNGFPSGAIPRVSNSKGIDLHVLHIPREHFPRPNFQGPISKGQFPRANFQGPISKSQFPSPNFQVPISKPLLIRLREITSLGTR